MKGTDVKGGKDIEDGKELEEKNPDTDEETSDLASDGGASHESDDSDSIPPDSTVGRAPAWEVLADTGWTPLSRTNAGLLEPEYLSPSPTPVTIKARGTQYLVDVAAMTQKNPSTNMLRPLRRLGGCAWECLVDKGWAPYDASITTIIERAHRARNEALCAGAPGPGAPGAHQKVAFTMEGRQYEVDLEGMAQVNKTTGFSRKVRRLGRVVWQFKGDAAWRAYGDADCLLLERRLADLDGAAAAAAAVDTADGRYTVDVVKMQQTNKQTSFAREVRRIPAAPWGWWFNSQWVLYDDADAVALELAEREVPPAAPVTLRSGRYKVDVAARKQTNVATGFVRKVCRVGPPPTPRPTTPALSVITDVKDSKDGKGEKDRTPGAPGKDGTDGSTDGSDGCGSDEETSDLASDGGASHKSDDSDSIPPDSTVGRAPAWEVLADTGWTPLSRTNAGLLEPEYLSPSPTPVTIKARGTQYLVDVAAMTQKNPSTNMLRPLRRLGGCAWECLVDKGWAPYDASITTIIERAHRARNEALCAGAPGPGAPGAHQKVAFTMEGRQYEVDLEGMAQVNKTTGFSRKVRRLGRVVWQFKGDAAWRAYGDADCLLLERRLADLDGAAAAAAAVDTADGRYTVDVVKMQQTNKQTSFAREVRRIPAAPWGWWFNSQWVLYDDADAVALELAEREVPPAAPVTLRSGRYKVDVAARKQTNVATGFVRKVCRVGPPPTPRPTTPSPDDGMPVTWSASDPMKAELVEVANSTAEWVEVEANFKATAGTFRVTRVQRVQNHHLWRMFTAARQSMASRGGGIGPNERQLFHGTDAATTEKIVVQGFNRSFVSIHAYGKGTYFARDASYSVSYSKPDAAGDQRMFLALVLVGDVCVGSASDIEPKQPRPGGSGPHDRCDTTVNDVSSPSIFVTYKDHQQYPSYLITFRT